MASMAVAIVRQYERGVVFRLGTIRGETVTMPIQSQQIITPDPG